MKSLLINNIKKYFLSFILAIVCIQNSFCFEKTQNDSTFIDLQNINFTNDIEVALDSNWAFYWNELLHPSHFNKKLPFKKISIKNWTKFDFDDGTRLPSIGYATYRLTINLPKKRPPLSLHIPAPYSSFKVWINGELVSETGIVGNSKENTFHRRFSETIPLQENATTFEIIIQVANFYHNKGGLVEAPTVATSKYLKSESSRLLVSDMIFIGSISFIGIFFLLFFSFYWNKDKAVLYFAILCLCWAYRALNDTYAPSTLIFPSITWTLLTRFKYIALFLGFTSACMFFVTIFSNYVFKLYPKIILYNFVLSFLLVVFLPPQYFTKLLIPYVYFMIICLGYMFFVIIRATIDRKSESILAMVSIISGLIIFCLHIFVFLGGNGKNVTYINLGYVVVFLQLSMLLMVRFSNSFRELEISKRIATKQKKEISIQSNQISKTNLKLQDNLKLLENHNSELDDFAHIVSHDLKSPLVAVNALVHFIQEDIKNDLDKTTIDHFSLVKERISKMGNLIDALLEYSKIAKGNKSKEMFKLNNSLQEIIDTINGGAKHSIILPEGDPEIYANETEIKHVFQNLLQNAIKHNDKEKAIITILFSKDTDKYQFSVEDNGPGIDRKYHRKIFEMFAQVNPNGKVKSTGIGLSIVKKIILENHGTISVESKKGTGTKINFTLKIDKEN